MEYNEVFNTEAVRIHEREIGVSSSNRFFFTFRDWKVSSSNCLAKSSNCFENGGAPTVISNECSNFVKLKHVYLKFNLASIKYKYWLQKCTHSDFYREVKYLPLHFTRQRLVNKSQSGYNCVTMQEQYIQFHIIINYTKAKKKNPFYIFF